MTAPGDAQLRDPGLQPERTRLAWRRTTLSCTVAAVLAARAVLHEGTTAVGVLACAVCLLLWLGFLVVAHRRMVALASHQPRTLAFRSAWAAALCTFALAVCAALMLV
ncbi:DUF202 domain-containing protein [Streptomyces sp. NPDC029674]|uniref:DUF202 domain-containing protein n=1 Tax=Streptomyces sp. NPDC029674 TaxID=3365297 RepID=UPI00384B15C9